MTWRQSNQQKRTFDLLVAALRSRSDVCVWIKVPKSELIVPEEGFFVKSPVRLERGLFFKVLQASAFWTLRSVVGPPVPPLREAECTPLSRACQIRDGL
jgi:hypothetical protein